MSCKIWPLNHWTVCQILLLLFLLCCLSVLFRQRHRNSEFRNKIRLLELEFRLTVYFWRSLNTLCTALRSFSSIWPLSEIWAANLVRSPLRSRSMTPPLLAPLPLHRFFFARSLTAPLPFTQFSARSALFFAPIPLRLHALLVNNQSRQRAISAALTHQVALTTVLASKLWIRYNLSRLRCGVPNSKLLE